MEEFKARKIIESLGSEAAEKGADAMTNEIIEDCCKANGVAPEGFRDFICENIDLQKLKELQGLEELSLKKLDQVAGGARPIKQGIASFLAATSLLGSATNVTGAAATGRHDLPKLPRVNLSAETPPDRRREKPQRQNGHPWAGVAKAVGIGSLIISAPYIARWLLSPTQSDVTPPTPPRADGVLSSKERAARYARFQQLLDTFKDIESFRTQISSDFPVTSTVISDLQDSRSTSLTLFDTDDIKAEIGGDNIAALRTKLRQCLTSARGAGRDDVPTTVPYAPPPGRHPYPASSPAASRSGPTASFETTQNRGSAAAVNYSDYGYSLYHYTPTEMNKHSAPTCLDNQARLTENVNSGITRLRLQPTTARILATKFFCDNQCNDPRHGLDGPGSDERNYVYQLPSGYCTVHDYSTKKPVKVTNVTCKKNPAILWWVERFTLPALFAVDKQLRTETRGQRGLDIHHTAVQNAGTHAARVALSLRGLALKRRAWQWTPTRSSSLIQRSLSSSII